MPDAYQVMSDIPSWPLPSRQGLVNKPNIDASDANAATSEPTFKHTHHRRLCIRTDMATISPLPAVEVEVDDFAIHSKEAGTSPLHSRDQTFSSPAAPPLNIASPADGPDYSFSSNIYDDYAASRSTSAHEDEYTTEEDNLDHLPAPVVAHSTRSSISSFPGSILPDQRQQRLLTPTKSPNPLAHPDILHHGRSGSLSYKIRSPASRMRDSDRMVPVEREYASGFRNPSSVRAMQMRDEEPFDSDPETTPHHRRSGSRMSNFSRRSVNTSPTKRSFRSTPHKLPSPSKLKKEFPLVLLHCSLLPPTLALKTHITDEALMEEVLPAEYWRRWKILQDKVGEENEVRTRGVLIPHPRDDYDVLEERLLESLELERPRIRKGHYVAGTTDVDSGVGTESERDTENDSDVEGKAAVTNSKPPKCADCGKRVPKEVEVDRKWEVKVYAANGLMRAGAWAAAWSEMEKVDVEVSVWMPEAVRREVDARLKELGVFDHETVQHEHEDSFVETEEERREREIYGRPSQGQETIDGLSDAHARADIPADIESSHGIRPDQPQSDLQTLAFRYVRGAMQDRRNIFMTLLSVLVLFLALSKPSTTKQEAAPQATVSAIRESPMTMASVSTLTSTEVVTATVVMTTTVVMPPEATILLPSSLASSAAETFSATSTGPAEPTEIDENALELSSSSVNSDGVEETPLVAHEQPLVLEQMVEILAGDDAMLE